MGERREKGGASGGSSVCVLKKEERYGRTVWELMFLISFLLLLCFHVCQKIINTYEIEINRRSIDDYMKVLCICRMLSLAHQQNEFEVDSSMPWCYCAKGGQNKFSIALSKR